MEFLKTEWLKLTLGLIYAVLTAAVLMAMGNIADNINSKADKDEVYQQIKIIKTEFITEEEVKEDIDTAIGIHEDKEIIRDEAINKMFQIIIENQDKILNKHDDRITRLENKN